MAPLFESVLIPRVVAAEITPTVSTLPAWLRMVPLRESTPPDVIRPSLGQGEREALSLAAELDANLLILDDFVARAFSSKGECHH